MFCTAALFAFCISAVSATRELTLAVSGPSSVNGVQELLVTASVKNTGDEALKLVNDPRTALNTLQTNAFDIVSESGASPAFTGVKAKYVIENVIASNDDASFTILAPGESAEIVHDLSKAYNFTDSAEGTYTINAKGTFTIVDEVGQAVELTAKTEAHTASIAGNLAVARTSNIAKRATYNGCTSTRQTQLATAYASAQSYAASALSYLNANTASTTRFVTWFGTYTTAHHTTVTSHFSKISGGSYSSFTYDCTCTDSGTYAYVYPDEFGIIYLCGAFWAAPNTGTDSRAGTLIHEASHFTTYGGTDDYAYGQTAAKALAKSNSANAVFNADSHEYFAENTPAQS